MASTLRERGVEIRVVGESSVIGNGNGSRSVAIDLLENINI
jgi:hypothetical protein